MTLRSRDSSWGSGASSEARPARGALLLALALLPGGCGQPRGVVFAPLETPMRWPQPPEPARIEYVGQLLTDRDLKPGKSFGKVLGDKLFGEDPAHSMLSPYAVCTDGDTRIFVADSNAQLVHVFDLDTRAYHRWMPDADGPPLAQPMGIGWDPTWHPGGRLLVADGAGGRVVVFDAEGKVTGTIGDDLVQRPCGIAVDPATGRIFVADATAHQVAVFDADGTLRRRLGRRGVRPGEFNYPTNLVLDAAGRLYVSDSMNFRVQVFDADLNPVRQIGSQGDLPGYFSQPKGVALDTKGHLYVVDAHFEAVQIFDDQGDVLLTFGREGREAGEFWLPAGIHIDSQDRIWVADAYNRRVQVFQFLAEAE